jgi:hypothetical protein
MRRSAFVIVLPAAALLSLSSVATARDATSAAAPASASACTLSTFKVVWGTAGVYNYPNGSVLYTKSYGEQVTGPTGGTSNGWTAVYQGGTFTIRYMKDPALQYLHCS